MKSFKQTKLLVILLPLLISGCATVFSGSKQNINIKVIDAKTQQELNDTVCKITGNDGAEYTMSTNPGVVNVTRGNGNLTILCKKTGYKQLNIAVGDSFNATTIANIIFWPGFIVDGLSGAYKKYPSHYVVVMENEKSK